MLLVNSHALRALVKVCDLRCRECDPYGIWNFLESLANQGRFGLMWSLVHITLVNLHPYTSMAP